MSYATLRARLGVSAAISGSALAILLVPSLAASANATSQHSTPLRSMPAAAVTRFTSAAPAPARVSAHARMMTRHAALVHKVIAEARRQKGKPYAYGADGPRAFDCSGLVRYVFMHSVHRVLPHNAAAQFRSAQHIARSQLRVGDLVFTDDGSITHVGIFAGHHRWWVAPHTGTRVQKQKIYHAHFVYARVLRLH